MAIKQKSGVVARLEKVRSGDYEELPPIDEDVLEIELSKIDLDADQPRKNIGDISGLTASIKEQGLLNPIIVRPGKPGRYIIIAGERRFHACKKAGRKAALCIIRTMTEQQTAAAQLVENLHRKDLDPFEEATAYARLKTNHNYTDAKVSQQVSKSRTHITQMLSLTRIPAPIQKKCQHADIPLSRDTLYLIAKQPTEAKMLQALKDSQTGEPREARREKARTGKAREATAPKKPKKTYTSTEAKATVIVQSHNSSLSKQRRIEALKKALKDERSG